MILPLLLAQAAPAAPTIAQPIQTPPGRTAAEGPGALGRDGTAPAGTAPQGVRLPRATESDIRVPLSAAAGDVDSGGLKASPAASTRRGQSVANRRRPEFDPAGIRAGVFIVYPEASTTVGYDSNVYRQPSGSPDAFGRLRGAVRVQSDLPRHALALNGFVDQRLYARLDTDNALTYDVQGTGRLDIDRSATLTATAGHSYLVVERGAAGEILRTRRPIRYDTTLAGLTGRKAFGRVGVELGGLVSTSDFQDAEAPDGTPILQRFRNFTLYQAHGEVGYELRSGATAFVSVTGEARRFKIPTPPIDRSSDSLEVLVGLNSEITPLLRGRIGIGYLRAQFADPTVSSRGGLGLNVALDYLLTELTTLKLSGRRELQNVASVVAPAALVTEVRVGADHELLRNLILSASAGYQDGEYINSGLRVKRYTASSAAQYLVSRRIRLDADVSFQRRTDDAQAIERDFSQLRASVGLAYRL